MEKIFNKNNAELKNNKMKKLNIHAGITDKVNIDFMEGKSKYNDINSIGKDLLKRNIIK